MKGFCNTLIKITRILTKKFKLTLKNNIMNHIRFQTYEIVEKIIIKNSLRHSNELQNFIGCIRYTPEKTEFFFNEYLINLSKFHIKAMILVYSRVKNNKETQEAIKFLNKKLTTKK